MTTSLGEIYTDVTNAGFNTLKDPDALALALEEFEMQTQETGEEPDSLFFEQRDAWDSKGFHPRREVSREKLIYDLNDETEDLLNQAIESNILSREEAAPLLLRLGVDVDPEWLLEDQDPTKMSQEEKEAYYTKRDKYRAEYAGRHAIKDEMLLRQELSPNAKKALDEGYLTGYETGFTEGVGDWYDDDHHWLLKGLYTIGLPQQAIFRNAVAAMDGLNAMSPEQAQAILAQKHVSFGDILNVYWSPVESKNERLLKEGIGLVGDILLDPVWLLKVNALTNAGKTARVSGHTYDLSKLGKGERAYVRALEDIGQVVSDANGSLKGVRGYGKKAIKQNEQVMELLAKDPAVYTIEDMNKLFRFKNNEVYDEIGKVYRQNIDTGPWYKDMANDWAKGRRAPLSVYGRVPFTNWMGEIPVLPGKKIGEGLNHLGDAIGAKTAVLSGSKAGQQITKIYNGLWSKTGKVQFDDGVINFHGSARSTEFQASESSLEYMKIMDDAKKTMSPDEFDVFLDDLSRDFESRMIHDEAVFLNKNFTPSINGEKQSFYDVLRRIDVSRKMLKPGAQKKLMDTPVVISENGTRKTYMSTFGEIEEIFGATTADRARIQRLSKYPEAMSKLDAMKKENLAKVLEYQERGMPFSPLNVFSSEGVGRYVKRTVDRKFFEANKLNEAGDEVLQALDVLSERSTLGSAVSGSEKGRKFRKSLKYYNEKSMKEAGMKVFVDNPAELHYRRMMEMDRAIRNYDLMEIAANYGVKGKPPGPGYVKFDPEDFSNLAFRDELTNTWDQFVPSYYKKAADKQTIYLPEQVYDRMLFTINGNWGSPNRVADLFSANEAVMRVWRNDMLFGAGYQGQNIFSNMFTLFNYHGPMIAKGLGQATKLAVSRAGLLKSKRDKIFITLNGVKHKSDDIWRMAVEDNLIASGFKHEMEFYDLAENISLTLPQRGLKKYFGTPKDAADTMLLWRANRWVAQVNDDVPKLAVYLDRLDKGFSRTAAREAAERYFYAYNVSGKSQQTLRSAFPFSTFPIKTFEMVGDLATSGEFGALAKLNTGPKVQSVLNGLYVQDANMREAFNEMTPEFFRDSVSKTHGEIMPGRNQVKLEAPWAISTMGMLTNPARHPFLQAYLIAAGTHLGGPEYQEVVAGKEETALMRLGRELIPPVILQPLTVMDIRDNTFDGFFADHYKPDMPHLGAGDEHPFPGAGVPGSQDLIQMLSSEELYDHIEKNVTERYGPDFLYDVVVGGKRIDELPEGPLKSQAKATAGNYIRSKFRQFTFGLASMKPIDRSFFIHIGSVNSQINKYRKKLQPTANEMIHYYNPDAAGTPEHLEYLNKRAKIDDDAKNLLTLYKYREVLKEYYEWASMGQELLPDGRFEELVFGYNPSQVPDTESNPDKIRKQIKKEEVDHLIEQLMFKQTPAVIPPGSKMDVPEEEPQPHPVPDDTRLEMERDLRDDGVAEDQIARSRRVEENVDIDQMLPGIGVVKPAAKAARRFLTKKELFKRGKRTDDAMEKLTNREKRGDFLSRMSQTRKQRAAEVLDVVDDFYKWMNEKAIPDSGVKKIEDFDDIENFPFDDDASDTVMLYFEKMMDAGVIEDWADFERMFLQPAIDGEKTWRKK